MRVDCPSCKKSFETEHGVKVHYAQRHGRSLAKQECTCENCGTVFEEFQSRIARGKGRFCSKECKHDSGETEATCYHCGETFQRAKHRTGRYEHDFCSRECHLDYRRTGGGVSWYGTNWREQRRKALERDGYECQSCGLDAESHGEVYGRGLDVHHIVPIAKFKTGDMFDFEAANDPSNLVTLCFECHQTWERIPVSPGVVI